MPTLIQSYASAVVAGFLARVEALTQLEHSLTKGELRELLVTELLSAFLSEQYGVGSGIVVNQAGAQSRQLDVVIFDKRLLPPFIRTGHQSVFPIESVLATVEVKTNLTPAAVRSARDAALQLKTVVGSPAGTIYPQLAPTIQPLCGVVGFYGKGPAALANLATGPAWLDQNAGGLEVLCLAGRWSWAPVNGVWAGQMGDDSAAYEETKRFVALLLDNMRTEAEHRSHILSQHHLDWMSVYLRDQHFFPEGAP